MPGAQQLPGGALGFTKADTDDNGHHLLCPCSVLGTMHILYVACLIPSLQRPKIWVEILYSFIDEETEAPAD